MDAQAEAADPYADVIEGMITTIPLDRLMLSTLNVRQTERAADVDSLAEDIAARGLKQNLVVIPAHFTSGEATEDQRTTLTTGPGGTGPWVNRFEVIAGGRRFQAMQLLVQQERLSATFPVPCMVEFRDAASETSLSENLHRVAMNPADEFEAFRVIVDQARGQGGEIDPVAYCAKRFGVTVKHVQGRLRLASLAPEILTALRHNEIGIESAKAYAGVEDHALQLKVYKDQAKSSWKTHDPRAVRDALRGVTVALGDARVKYLGIDAYREAGGRVETEMFMGSDGVERVVDVKLLDKLVRAKAVVEIAALAKKDGYQSGLFAQGVGWNVQWPKPPKGFEKAHYYEQTPTKTAKKKSIGVYALNTEGTVLELKGRYKPEGDKKQEQGYKPETEAEREERLRQERIDERAARLAVGPFAGTPLEGKAVWPQSHWVNPVTENEDHVLVAILVKVSTDDVLAQRAEAERLIDEEAEAARREKLLAELKAKREAAQAEPYAENVADIEDAIEQ